LVKNPLVDLAAYIRNMQRKYALSLRQMAERVTQEEIPLSVEKKLITIVQAVNFRSASWLEVESSRAS
jgi:hypothetical protein